MSKTYSKYYPTPILETMPAMFKCDTQFHIALAGCDIWAVVHTSRVDGDTVLLEVTSETEDHFSVRIPGEMLEGPRKVVLPISKAATCIYKLNP